MIQTADRDRFTANYAWFNQFFVDMKQLFERIQSNLLQAGLILPKDIFYYPFAQRTPSLPGFYGMGLGGVAIAVQVFAIFDPMMLQHHTGTFDRDEPSLIVVKHGRGDKYDKLYNYGLKVVERQGLADVEYNREIFSGRILTGTGIPFAAFQVPLKYFLEGQDINRQINEHIVEVIRGLPDWE